MKNLSHSNVIENSTGYRFDAENHIHTLDGKPLMGTSTVIDVLGKVLTWWASGKAVEQFGWMPLNKNDTGESIPYKDKKMMELRKIQCFFQAVKRFGEIKQLTDERYFDLLASAYRAHDTHKKEKATEGTDLHSEVERFINDQIFGVPNQFLPYDEKLKPFIDWSNENVKQWLFSELHCFCSRLWTGGIIDNGYIDKQGRLIVGDVKSAKKAYFGHCCQVGGYCSALTEQKAGFNAKGEKTFSLAQPIAGVAIFPFGGGFNEPFVSYEPNKFMSAFDNCVQLYKARQEFEGE